MILNLIDDMVEARLTELVNSFDGTIMLRRAKSNIDLEKISSGESNICYQTYIESVSEGENETFDENNVDVVVYFKFMIVNKDSSKYREVLDRYVYGLYRKLRDVTNQEYYNYDISQALKIIGINNVQINDANNFEDEYFKPNVTFTANYRDTGNLISQTIINLNAL